MWADKRSTEWFALRLLILRQRRLPPHNLLQTLRLGPPRLPEVLVDFVPVTHLRPRESDQLPSDQPRVAAMHRVGEHPLDGVRPQQREKVRLLDRGKLSRLLLNR